MVGVSPKDCARPVRHCADTARGTLCTQHGSVHSQLYAGGPFRTAVTNEIVIASIIFIDSKWGGGRRRKSVKTLRLCKVGREASMRGQTKINKGASGNHRVASLLAHCQRSFGARRRCRLAGKGKRGMRRGSTRTSHGGRYKKKGSLCSNFFLVRVLYLMSIIQSILVAAAVGQAHDMCRIHTDSANWTAYPWRNASVIVKPGYHSAPSPFSFQYRKTYLCYLAKHGMTLWLNSTRSSSANPPRYSPTAAVDDFPSTWGPLCIPLIPTCSA